MSANGNGTPPSGCIAQLVGGGVAPPIPAPAASDSPCGWSSAERMRTPNECDSSEGGAADSARSLRYASAAGGGGGPILAALGAAGGTPRSSREGAGAPDALSFAFAPSANSREMSPNPTPLSTPTLHRREDTFGGPTLNLFARPLAESREQLPPSQSFPGREANEAASLMSFHTAMLAEVTAEREESDLAGGDQRVDGGVADAEERRQEPANETANAGGWSTPFLWPTSLNLPGIHRPAN